MKTYFRVLGTNAIYIVLLLFIIIHLTKQITCNPNLSYASFKESLSATVPGLPIASEPVPVGVTAQK